MQDLYPINTSAAITQIDDRRVGFVAGEDFRLLKLFGERVAIIRVTWEAPGADDESSFCRDRDAYFHAKFIRLSCFALADAFDFWGMQSIELVFPSDGLGS